MRCIQGNCSFSNMRVRYARAVDIVGGTHDGGGLPNRGGWKGEDVCRSARSRVLGRSASGQELETLGSSASRFPTVASKARVAFVAIVVVD
jgi:hypothetical protein